MAVVSFPARNKLAYPAGTRAGIDPNHPAARNCVAAPVAVNGQYIDLIDGRLGTTVKATAPTVGIDGVIGPNSSFTVNTNFQYKFAGPNLSQAAWTIASIFNYTASSGAGLYQTLGAIGGNGVGGFWLKDSKLNFYDNGDNQSTFTLTVGQSYFTVMSGGTALGNSVYMVAKNLITGQVQFCTVTVGGAPSTPVDDFFLFGNDGSGATGELANCKIAAAMYSPILLPMPQLLQWADDPWAFWYPQQMRMRVTAAAVATAQYLAFVDQNDGSQRLQMIGY